MKTTVGFTARTEHLPCCAAGAALPKTPDDLVACVQIAAEMRLPIVPRGGGTVAPGILSARDWSSIAAAPQQRVLDIILPPWLACNLRGIRSPERSWRRTAVFLAPDVSTAKPGERRCHDASHLGRCSLDRLRSRRTTTSAWLLTDPADRDSGGGSLR